MKEVETHLQSCPVAGIKTWVQTQLVDYQTQLEKCSKEVSFSALLLVFFKRLGAIDNTDCYGPCSLKTREHTNSLRGNELVVLSKEQERHGSWD